MKDPAMVVAAMVTLVLGFGGGVMIGAAWFVTPEVESLRGEVTGEIQDYEGRVGSVTKPNWYKQQRNGIQDYGAGRRDRRE